MNEAFPSPTHNRDTLLMQWDTIKKQMSALKDEEQKLRKTILDMEFAGAKSGTNRVPLGNGYSLKAIVKYTYKITKNEAVDPPDYSHVPAILSRLPAQVAADLIKWEPRLSESAYKKLTEEEKKIANEFLIISDGSSTLEIEEPKPKKA